MHRQRFAWHSITSVLWMSGCALDWDGQLTQLEHERELAAVPASATLWLTANEGVETASDGSVIRWLDRSGHDHHALPNGGQPVPHVLRDADRTVLTFSGEDELALPMIPAMSELTFFAVAMVEDDDIRCPSLLHLSNSHDIIVQQDDIEFGRHTHELYYENGSNSVPAGDAPTTSFSVGSAHVLTVRHGSDQRATSRVDGVQVHERDMPLADPMDRTWNFIGKNHYYANGEPWCAGLKGQLAELLLYPRSLDEGEQARVEAYLSEKWSVPLCPCDDRTF